MDLPSDSNERRNRWYGHQTRSNDDRQSAFDFDFGAFIRERDLPTSG